MLVNETNTIKKALYHYNKIMSSTKTIFNL